MMTMEDMVLLILLSSSFCSFVQSYDKNTTNLEFLDDILHEHALKALLTHHRRSATGTLYKVSLPASLSGMEVSYVRLRSKTLWRKGANFSNLQIPPRTLPIPHVKRVVIVYQDFGNLSSQFYNETFPGYSFVSSVVGFTLYDASNPVTRNIRELDFNVTATTVSVRFPNTKLPRGAKCAFFGGLDMEVSLGDVSGGNSCCSRSYRRFSIVVPLKRKKKEVWVRWGVVFLMVVLVGFVGTMIVKITKVKRIDEMEREADESVDLETIWIGYSKMPSATVIRTHPVLETAGFA